MAGSLGCVADASVSAPWAAGSSFGVRTVSARVPHVAVSPAGVPEASAVRFSRQNDLRSWSVSGPNSLRAAKRLSGGRGEFTAGRVREAFKRWTRRTHCWRLSDSPGAIGQCLLRSRFGFACVFYGEVMYGSPEINGV